MKLQEDRFILTTEIETEGSKYKITHKAVNHSNKKICPETITFIFEFERSLDLNDNLLSDLAKSQKQFILKNMNFC